jgi:hypothetical protein
MIGSHELAAKAGISYRMLDYWCRTGLIHADRDTPGSGNARTYTDDQARLCVLLARLVRGGLDPRTAAEMAARMLRTGEADLAGFRVTAPGRVRRRGWHLAGRRWAA